MSEKYVDAISLSGKFIESQIFSKRVFMFVILFDWNLSVIRNTFALNNILVTVCKIDILNYGKSKVESNLNC